MAVITFDDDNNSVSILVEKNDLIKNKDGATTSIMPAVGYSSGEVFINDRANVCIIRGERYCV